MEGCRPALLIFLVSCIRVSSSQSASATSTVMYGPCTGSVACLKSSLSNRIVLGGLFPIHNVVCNGEVSVESLQWVTAMDEAVRDVNSRNIISSTGQSVVVSLGYEIRDTCRRDTVALQEILSFLGRDSSSCSGGSSTQQRKLVGVVGPFSSSVSIRATRLLQLFRLPMISYGSTSPQLSNKETYPYFLRTLPSDNFLARAIVRAARQRGWTFINLVHTGDAFGRDGSTSVLTEARAAGMCISSVTEIHEDAQFNNTQGLQDYARAWNRLLVQDPDKNSAVTVLFVQETNARDFFLFGQHNPSIREAALRKNITFLGVDSWGDILSAVRDSAGDPLAVAIGSVSPIPFNKILQSFDVTLAGLRPNTDSGRKNPWLSAAWLETFRCSPSNASCATSNSFTARAGYVQSSKVAMVYDAVYAFSYALRSILRNTSLCPTPSANCPKLRDGVTLLETLQRLSFPGVNSDPFLFNRNGDPLSSIYAEKNMVVDSMNAVSFPTVGIYSATETNLSAEGCRTLRDFLYSDNACFDVSFNNSVRQIIWNDGTTNTPRSICSENCLVGQSRMIRQTVPPGNDYSCCWTCTDCQNAEFSNLTNADTCWNCKSTERVVKNNVLRNIACSLLPVQFYSIEHPLALVVAAIAGLSKIAVLTMLVFQFTWWESDRYLPWPLKVTPTAVSLAGIFIILVAGQLFVVRPSPTVCSVNYGIATAGITLAIVPVILFVWEWYTSNTDTFNEEFSETSTFWKQRHATNLHDMHEIVAANIDHIQIPAVVVGSGGDVESECQSHAAPVASPLVSHQSDLPAVARDTLKAHRKEEHSPVTKPPSGLKDRDGFQLLSWLTKMVGFLALYAVLLAVSLVLKVSDIKDGVTAHVSRTLTCADSGAVLFGFGWLLLLLLVLLVSSAISVKSIQNEDNTFEADLIKTTLFSVLICTICVIACTSVYTASPLSVIRNGAVSLCLCLVALSFIGVVHGPRFYYIVRHRAQLLQKYDKKQAAIEPSSTTVPSYPASRNSTPLPSPQSSRHEGIVA